MSSMRWPALVLIPALLIGGFLIDDRSRPEPVAPSVGFAADIFERSSIEPAESDSATWFCTAGALDADGAFRIRIVNTADTVRRGQLMAFVTAGPGGGIAPAPKLEEVTVEPFSAREVDIGSVVGEWPFAAVSVELDGGAVLVEQLVDARTGSDSQPCASRAASSWYLPVGSTLLGAAHHLLLFNPFPEDAVVDLLAATENGVRQSDFVGEVVPARSVVVIEVGERVQVADQLAMTVDARVGRIVAGVIQVFDPEAPSAPDTRGLAAVLGTTTPSEIAYLPEVLAGDRIVVHNPSSTDQAEVEVAVLTDEAIDAVESFELTIFPNQEQILDLTDDARIGGALRFTVVVQSYNGVPVVVGRRSLVLPAVDDPDDPVDVDAAPVADLAIEIATAESARRLLLDLATSPIDGQASRVTLVNPSFETISTVTLSVIADGELSDGVLTVELPPGGRESLPVADLGQEGSFTLLIEATAPVIAQRDLISSQLGTRSAALAVPFLGTVEALEPTTFGG